MALASALWLTALIVGIQLGYDEAGPEVVER